MLGQGLLDAFEGADGLGIMGEAGPEAILPLARRSDSGLGVKAAMTRAGGDVPQGAYRLAA